MLRHVFNKRLKYQKQNVEGKQNDIPSTIYTDIHANLDNIKRILNAPSDFIQRTFTISDSEKKCAIVCIDGLVDKDMINDQLIKNIQLGMQTAKKEVPASSDEILKKLKNEVLSTYELKIVDILDDVLLAILSGDTALFINGTDKVLLVGSKGWDSRGIDEPQTESLVRGPREGFTENIRTNT
ncbi:MAG TPA: spore germination protein, partial [Ureibacillus sp.]|nr:spore germination protein [Ureibacillus sp.]